MTLAGLRTHRDARSIGLALAFLVLVNAILVGIGGGAYAETPHSIFCGTAGQPSDDGTVPPGHDHDCCVPAASAAPNVSPPAIAWRPVSAPAQARIARDGRWDSVRPVFAAEPRGPPRI